MTVFGWQGRRGRYGDWIVKRWSSSDYFVWLKCAGSFWYQCRIVIHLTIIYLSYLKLSQPGSINNIWEEKYFFFNLNQKLQNLHLKCFHHNHLFLGPFYLLWSLWGYLFCCVITEAVVFCYILSSIKKKDVVNLLCTAADSGQAMFLTLLAICA